jgi:hypothetical protein
MSPGQRWWYCTECFAVNDGLEQSSCWNCDHYERKRKHFPWCEMGKGKCGVCGRAYVIWTLPAGTSMTVPEVLGFCPLYLEDSHSGPSAYFPPMLPAFYVLEANGYRYDGEKNKVVKLRSKA